MVLTYKVKDSTGVYTYIEADRVLTDDVNKVINFYREDTLVAKIPIAHLIIMGLIDFGKEDKTNEITRQSV